MKKYFIILLAPVTFLFYGATMDNFPLSIGPCFLFTPDMPSHETETARNNSTNEIQNDKRNLHKEFNIEEGKTLDINLNSGGSISISGWDKKTVAMDVESSRSNIEDYTIDFSKSDNGINVNSDLTNRKSSDGGLHFNFNVPSNFNLKIESSGGSVEIKSVNGNISGQTMGGPLNLSNLKGKIDLQTMGGPVKFYDSEVDGRVHTMGGPVEIINVKGDVKCTTNGGPVKMKNVSSKSYHGKKDVITVSSMGGDINMDEAPEGANLKTMGGAIIVRSAKKFVKARTNGGSIEIGNTDGAIDASTMGGDVKAEMVGNPDSGNRDVDLSSKSGDITLIVPDGLSMDIEITLAYTRDSDEEYSIYSDFPIKQETTPKWSDEYGTSRKIIYGKGKTGDGKNKIRIETINGNVYLKKG